jgi:hypothetical protein
MTRVSKTFCSFIISIASLIRRPSGRIRAVPHPLEYDIAGNAIAREAGGAGRERPTAILGRFRRRR